MPEGDAADIAEAAADFLGFVKPIFKALLDSVKPWNKRWQDKELDYPNMILFQVIEILYWRPVHGIELIM